MLKLINNLHKSAFFGHIFHTLDYCLQQELADCETVLDLGCGPSSPLQYCKNIKHSVGVEVFQPYLEISKKKRIHTEYVQKDLLEVELPNQSFDAVILIEVIEHFTEEDASTLIKRAESWAKKKVIITTPNGYINQKAVDNNPYQRHLSGWTVKKIEGLGYKCKGLAGLKYIRQEVQDDTMGDNLLTSIKYQPKLFWFAFATVSQLICHHLPRFSFGLFVTKIYGQNKR